IVVAIKEEKNDLLADTQPKSIFWLHRPTQCILSHSPFHTIRIIQLAIAKFEWVQEVDSLLPSEHRDSSLLCANIPHNWRPHKNSHFVPVPPATMLGMVYLVLSYVMHERLVKMKIVLE
ncbi:hypothetical protein, partial [Flagellimonas marinaquae]